MAKLYNFLLSTLVILCLLQDSGWGQETQVVEGWKYIPQNQEIYDKIDALKKNQKLYEAINLAFDYQNEAKIEGKLFLAQILLDVGLNTLAVEYFKEIIKDNPGTFMSQQALLEISQVVPRVPTYFVDLSALLNRGAFKDVPQGVDSMIHYFVTLDNMRKNEYRWAFDSLRKIKSDNFWGQNIQYLKALELVKMKDLKKADEALVLLIEKESIHPTIKQNAILQHARILFELKDYDLAEKEYLKLESRGRDTGRILYERALVAYHQRKYAHALGLLESLKSENFKTAFNPEQVILEMMIYRDLCHYPTVKKIANEFEKKYNYLINYFKSGQDLSKSQVIKKIIFQNLKYKESADLINALRTEKKELKQKHTALNAKLIKKLQADLSKYEKLYFMNIENEIKPLLKPAAFEFMVKAEEIRLLEYISGLDEFRIKNVFESRKYTPEESTRKNDYNILFWPVQKEYWWEEFKNYQVLLVDRCDGTPLNKGGKQ